MGLRQNEILKNIEGISERISAIRFYKKNISALKRFSCATWTSRQHVIVAIQAGNMTGFAESIISVNDPNISLEDWCKCGAELIELSVSEAIRENRKHQDQWQEQLIEMFEMALLDLGGKIKGVTAIQLLGLSEQNAKPVCGVHVILSDNVEEVAKSTKWALENDKASYIKVKLFGKTELDESIIKTVRSICPSERTVLIGDVNCGYRSEKEKRALEWIAQQLKVLKNAGLDACEDPGFLEIPEWVSLQKKLPDLALIPDYPMRHSRKSVNQICEGMGKIYNIHPDSAGSVIDAVVLAERIRQLGAELMIGDDSLVGPSASIWQQIASALGARWVEATEKREESDFYYRCVRSLATDSTRNPICIHWSSGFGIDLDLIKLQEEADEVKEVTK